MTNKMDIKQTPKKAFGDTRLSELKKASWLISTLEGKEIANLKPNEVSVLLMAICLRLGISNESGKINIT